MPTPNKFVTVEEAAELAGVTHWTIRLWLKVGKLTRYKSASRTVINRTQLLALVEPKKAEGR